MGALKCRIVHVGKFKRPFVLSGIEHFSKKIKPYATLSLAALKEEPLRKGTTPETIRSVEGARILKQMDGSHTWIALDPQGQSLESAALASILQNGLNHGRSRLTFLIGGPHGLDPEIVAKADIALSLSRMTFSHELTILVLLEQIYRSLAIMHNLPYPK